MCIRDRGNTVDGRKREPGARRLYRSMHALDLEESGLKLVPGSTRAGRTEGRSGGRHCGETRVAEPVNPSTFFTGCLHCRQPVHHASHSIHICVQVVNPKAYSQYKYSHLTHSA
eukprot:3734114-Prymnesium_polylepis.1